MNSAILGPRRDSDTVHIIACETLRPELDLVMKASGCAYPIRWVDTGKHAWPDKLSRHLQETIDSIPAQYTTLLLAYGFCGNAMVGLRSASRTLVLPRAADCIPLFLGSQAERNRYGPATYFFTEGCLHSGAGLSGDLSTLQARYGEEKGIEILEMMMEHYRGFAVIDTGASDTAKLSAEIDGLAVLLGLPVSVIPGNLRLLVALITGNWRTEEFLLVPPGGQVNFADSLFTAL
ncbi:hypothetical protein FACS189493_8120 [Spirochaetia bacterium]|nr:hypothetical protein FACS189493_8120 [Spirochaetia bacterium]